MVSRRSGRGAARAVRTASRSTLPSAPSAPGISTSLRPVRPVSIERSAFCSDSAKHRPIAMASPTDFIEVVRIGSAPGNFSKVKRGILVHVVDGRFEGGRRHLGDVVVQLVERRSEEHTSELPSLIRITYAVFYLT